MTDRVTLTTRRRAVSARCGEEGLRSVAAHRAIHCRGGVSGPPPGSATEKPLQTASSTVASQGAVRAVAPSQAKPFMGDRGAAGLPRSPQTRRSYRPDITEIPAATGVLRGRDRRKRPAARGALHSSRRTPHRRGVTSDGAGRHPPDLGQRGVRGQVPARPAAEIRRAQNRIAVCHGPRSS